MFLVLFIEHQSRRVGVKSHAASEFLQLARTGIRGHDDDGIAEVHETTVAICQTTFVQHLQQQVENIAVSFFNLVEQHDRVGVTTHALRQLSALLITDISRRRTDESRHVERLRIFAHIDTDECV